MPTTETQRRASKKWNENNMQARYDRVSVLVPKGHKPVLQAHATARNESLNGFINRAIDETMERDEGKEG